MNKIFILGYYGYHNSGDEFILQNLISDLNEYKKNIIILSNTPRETTKNLNVKSIPRFNIIKFILRNVE